MNATFFRHYRNSLQLNQLNGEHTPKTTKIVFRLTNHHAPANSVHASSQAKEYCLSKKANDMRYYYNRDHSLNANQTRKKSPNLLRKLSICSPTKIGKGSQFITFSPSNKAHKEYMFTIYKHVQNSFNLNSDNSFLLPNNDSENEGMIITPLKGTKAHCLKSNIAMIGSVISHRRHAAIKRESTPSISKISKSKRLSIEPNSNISFAFEGSKTSHNWKHRAKGAEQMKETKNEKYFNDAELKPW